MEEFEFNEQAYEEEVATTAKNNYTKLAEIKQEAEDRIWYDRATKQDIEVVAKVANKYNIKEEDMTDFYHGYWSGILALSRWLSGEYSDDINDIRDPADSGLLDS